MDENHPKKQDDSPIRGLFRRNEEAYRQHEQESAAGQVPEEMPTEQTQEIETGAFAAPASAGGSSRWKQIWKKVVAVITAPEDGGLMLEDDEDAQEEIFSPEPLRTAEEEEEPLWGPPETIEQRTAPLVPEEGDTDEESILFGMADDEIDLPVTGELPEIPPAFWGEQTQPEPEDDRDIMASAVPEPEEEAEEDGGLIYMAQEPPIRRNAQGVTEISMDAVLHAREYAPVGETQEYSADQMEAEILSHRQAAVGPHQRPAPPPMTPTAEKEPPAAPAPKPAPAMKPPAPAKPASGKGTPAAPASKSAPAMKPTASAKPASGKGTPAAPASKPAPAMKPTASAKPASGKGTPAAPASKPTPAMKTPAPAKPASGKGTSASPASKPAPALKAPAPAKPVSGKGMPAAPASKPAPAMKVPAPAKPASGKGTPAAPTPKPAPAAAAAVTNTSAAPTGKPPVPAAAESPAAHAPQPWTPPVLRGKNEFDEPAFKAVTYHHTEEQPFLVMVGKFSKTLREEYETVLRLRPDWKTPTPVQQEAPLVKPEPSEASPAQASAKPAAGTTASEKTPVARPTAAEGEKPAGVSRRRKPAEEEAPRRRSFTGGLSDLFGVDAPPPDPAPSEVAEAASAAVPRREVPIEDYNQPGDEQAIREDIRESFSRVAMRTVVLTLTCTISVIMTVMSQAMPQLFAETIQFGWLVFGMLNLTLLLISLFVSRYQLGEGISGLIRLKGNSHTALSVAAVAVTIQSVCAAVMPNVFVNGTYRAYAPLLLLAMLLHSIGQLLIVKRTADNFRFLCRPDAKYAGKILTDQELAHKLVKDLPCANPLTAYVKPSRFMSNFLRLSYATDPSEEMAAFLSLFGTALSLVIGITYGVLTKDFVGGASSFALSSCITIPMCSLIAINLPMKRLCEQSLRQGAMVVGYEAVKQFSDTNVMMLDAAQLYPPGTITFSGMRPIINSQMENALESAAAISFAVGGPMTDAFEKMFKNRMNRLPKVDSVTYHDALGLSAWVENQRILMGTRKMMEKYSITVPDSIDEEAYRKSGKEVVYMSISGDLVAVFLLQYRADRKIAEALRELSEKNVYFVIRTIDQNITRNHVADKFHLYARNIDIIPTKEGNDCRREMSTKEKSTRAYLVTNGSTAAFAKAVSGCFRIRSIVTLTKIIQVVAIVFGLVLVTVLSFGSGFEKLGCVELLLYSGFWCVALLIASQIAKRLG